MVCLTPYGLVLVGLIWGVTNPLMEEGSKEKSNKKESSDIDVGSLFKTLTNWRFILPYAVNQGGSGLYYYLLSSASLSVAPVVSNSIAFLATYFVENKIKKLPFTTSKECFTQITELRWPSWHWTDDSWRASMYLSLIHI
eukprot:TRINITY_DN8704_c0_g2_i2.p1 TRINITY_DN8704_c0_g2~~TRINITY_DN8704_c0_g2_i2.p1  ORF type:complete len:140 (-),score=13.71 TRINITY_DN8704_c0_g2_i2:61-480(-)